MNHLIWAEDVNDHLARVLKSRYYGEISYLDHCIGKLLDAVEALPNPDNVLIAFFTDHGDHMGDHHAWQKESWFEASAKIPFLVSWPQKITGGVQNHALVSLTDLFAIATSAAGALETRDGIDVLGMLEGTTPPRDCLFGLYGTPGTPLFKIMVRQGSYKYNFFANGGRRQLFDLAGDPGELRNLAEEYPGTAAHMHTQAVAYCKRPGLRAALDSDEMKTFAFEARPLNRINQMAWDRGVKGFSFLP
jgi:choline-sulfatase